VLIQESDVLTCHEVNIHDLPLYHAWMLSPNKKNDSAFEMDCLPLMKKDYWYHIKNWKCLCQQQAMPSIEIVPILRWNNVTYFFKLDNFYADLCHD
jgi:hypothetical protein